MYEYKAKILKNKRFIDNVSHDMSQAQKQLNLQLTAVDKIFKFARSQPNLIRFH